MKQDIIGLTRKETIKYYKVNKKNKIVTVYMLDKSKVKHSFQNDKELEEIIKNIEQKMTVQMCHLIENDKESLVKITEKKMRKVNIITNQISFFIPFFFCFYFHNFLNLILMPLLYKVRRIFLNLYENNIEKEAKQEIEKYEIFYNNHNRFKEYENVIEKEITINNIDSHNLEYLKEMREYIINLQVEEVNTKINALKQKIKIKK